MIRRHDFGCTCRTHVGRPWHRPEHWTTAEVAYLERSFGRIPDERIAKKLGRSVLGLRLRAKRLGLRKRDAGLTARDVARIFGVDPSTVADKWIVGHSVLRARPGFRQGPHPVWLVSDAEVKRFIRECPEWITVAKMPDSPYRDLAARDPWVGTAEVHRLTGRGHHAIALLIASGTIRGRRRGVHWYVPLSDVALIRALPADHIAESVFRRESVLEMRRLRRKKAA